MKLVPTNKPRHDDELLHLCSKVVTDYTGTMWVPYWTAESNGLGRGIREYSRFPRLLPLCISTDHAPRMNGVLATELNCGAPVQFYHYKNNVERWRRLSRTPCYSLRSPFVCFRQKYHIQKSPTATGTIAFLAHGGPELQHQFDHQEYAEALRTLPEVFHPISICFHAYDIEHGVHLYYKENGFDVYTAGNVKDRSFIPRFYDILCRFRYTTSSVVGSYAYYATELGIPFFLTGEHPVITNNGDSNWPKVVDHSPTDPDYRSAQNVFTYNLPVHITDDQRVAMREILGLDHGIGSVRLGIILYVAFLKWMFHKSNSRIFFRALMYKLKQQ